MFITFLSDFGLKDGFVGTCHGVMKRIAPDAQIIDISRIPPSGKVIFGSTVTLTAAESGAEVTYKLVGEDEADLKAGKLSVMSPIGRALIGKVEGDVVTVRTPKGAVDYEIDRVEHR